ncbi:hypothetical protein JR316_0002596 [Psilocybe cubensis]|uniref:Uncharacterized protein n=2 Tax=Psilocybe cubensis TaxID=181762 RepID=A0ACB8HCT4_PSICU|nr:hypothetical protein JR316_0002596 [Psilocybe cubensis]KAH9485686.1 hypothetical protein JR316_0002596 [Psilocybe cubensis]
MFYISASPRVVALRRMSPLQYQWGKRGNIMGYCKNLDDDNQPWRVILADLEYAKKFPPGEDYLPSLDPKTGTPYFMPVEIMTMMTLFSGNVCRELVASSTNKSSAGGCTGIFESSSSVSQEEDIYLRAQRKRQAAREKKEKEKDVERPKGVAHNFQHDLESTWRLVLWLITSRTGDKPAQEYSRQIFQNTMQFVPERWQAVICEIEEELRKCMGPLGDYFAGQLEDLRSAMLLTYIERERDDKTKEVSSYVPISQAFRTFFQDIEKTKDIWANIPLIAQNHYIDPAERKRPRPDDDEGFPGLIDDGAEPKMKLPKT